MDYDRKLSNLKKSLLGLIRKAATQNDSSGVVVHSKYLEEVEKLIEKAQNISDRIYDLEKRIFQKDNVIDSGKIKQSLPEPVITHISAKAKGKIRRENFLKLLEEKGVSLSQIKGIIYKSAKSNKIGIASASERPEGNRWFLGLPPDDYDAIVLLCEDSQKRVYHIILPPSFVIKYRYEFSRDSNNQIKLNVLKENDKFLIMIPGHGNIDVSNYLNNYENV